MSDSARLSTATYLALGLRNLRRNPRRTGLSFASLVAGVGALTFLMALNEGWLSNAKENFILTFTGHVQVHARGFEDSQQIEDHIADAEPVTRLLRGDAAVAAWTTRLRVSGLASVAEASTAAQIVAVDPLAEARVSRLPSFVVEGQWLHEGDARGLLLGVKLADNLGASLGDKVVLMAQTPGGDIVAQLFRLRGILRAGAPDVDRLLALVPLDTAQRWLELEGGVTDVVVRAAWHDATDGIRERLSAALPAASYEVLRWMDIDPMIQQWLEFSDAYTFVILLPVIAVVLAEIINTMLMALYERVREFGLMEALGTTKSQLFAMVLWESVALVMAGGMAGYALGATAALYFGRVGIDLSAFSDAFTFLYMSPVVRPRLGFGAAVVIFATTLAAALAAGVYPAWRATRLDPVASMRQL